MSIGKFSEFYVDVTKDATKIPQEQYLAAGRYPIIDQGQKSIAGMWDNPDGLYEKVPAIVFGDHTRALKYVDMPFFIGADGVKVLRPAHAGDNVKYLFYVLQAARIPNLGYSRHFKVLKELEIQMYPRKMQDEIVRVLEQIDSLLEQQQNEILQMDQLVKSRFVEMFGDRDSFAAFPLESNVEEMFIGPFGSSLKNECFVHENEGYCMVYEQKHAIRKTMNVETRYVTEEKYKELKRFNVQGGDIIVSCRGTIGETYIVPENAPLGIMHPSIMKIRLKSSAYNNVFFDFLLQDTLQKHNTDANGSGVKMAVTANALGKEVFIQPAMHLQNRFSAFVAEVDKSKLAVKQSLEKLETLKKSLMQQYFG